MKKFDFTKMHGLGNDFVIIDERDMKVNLSRTEIISVANRHTGIGCDQLITIGINSESNILIRFFNSEISGLCWVTPPPKIITSGSVVNIIL